MKVLFITRKYPPQTGGMENCMYGIISNYPGEKVAITLGKPQIHLIWFYPYALVKALWIIATQKIDIIHLSDGVMTPLGFMIKNFTRKPVSFTAHGLDINFNHPLYKRIMPYFFTKMDHVVCVSNATKQVCIDHGITENKITIIPNGINPDDWKIPESKIEAREKIAVKYNLDLKDKKILVSVGRLARRKGFRWFVESVMPKLGKEYIYIIIGSGGHAKNSNLIPEIDMIKQAIKSNQLGDQVFLLGKIPFTDLKLTYKAADCLVMPNIPIEGDMEGFGIVAIEAGASGLPVVASRLEGIQDAIIEGKTGYFAETKSSDSFADAIVKTQLLKSSEIQNTVSSYFCWEKVTSEYRLFFSSYKPVKT